MTTEFKYRAFISYSHADEEWAKWLHKALETYRVPKHLVGRETEFRVPGFLLRRDRPTMNNLEIPWTRLRRPAG
jgi:hypothetical protein